MEQFQPKTLVVALAGALGAGLLATPAAYALDEARTNAALVNNPIFYSGATAPTKTIWQAFRALCKISVADPFNVYKAGTVATNFDPGDSGYGNQFLYSCKFKSAGDPAPIPPVWQGLDVAMSNGVADGSFSSVRGMTTTTASQQLMITNVTACTGTALNSNGDVTSGSCTTVNKQSMGGFSDVERDMFQDLLPIAGVQRSDVRITNVGAGQTFGVSASEVLYRALQAAQGLPAGCQNDGAFTSGTIVGLDDRSAECQPSISTQEYSSIANNVKGATPKTAGWGFMAPALAGTGIVLCRRVDVSGTQASSNVFFLNRPCARGPLTGGERIPLGANSGLIAVVLNSGSSNVRACLNNTTPAGGSQYRIGILSGENIPDPTDRFAYMKVDGVAINEDTQHRQTAIDGKYHFAYEMVLHTNNSTTITPNAQFQVLSTIGVDLGNPNVTDLRGLYQTRLGGFAQTSFPTKVAKGTRNNNSCSPFTY